MKLGWAARLVVAALAALALCVPLAGAQAVHRIAFKVGPTAMVWDGSGALHQGASVELSLGTDGHMLASEAHPVLTGILQPAALQPAQAIDETISIATNTAFDVEALSMAGWHVTVERVATGRLARPVGPALAHSVELLPGQTQTLFQAMERTAARPGDPRDQAITLRIRAEPAGTMPPEPLRIRMTAKD